MTCCSWFIAHTLTTQTQTEGAREREREYFVPLPLAASLIRCLIVFAFFVWVYARAWLSPAPTRPKAIRFSRENLFLNLSWTAGHGERLRVYPNQMRTRLKRRVVRRWQSGNYGMHKVNEMRQHRMHCTLRRKQPKRQRWPENNWNDLKWHIITARDVINLIASNFPILVDRSMDLALAAAVMSDATWFLLSFFVAFVRCSHWVWVCDSLQRATVDDTIMMIDSNALLLRCYWRGPWLVVTIFVVWPSVPGGGGDHHADVDTENFNFSNTNNCWRWWGSSITANWAVTRLFNGLICATEPTHQHLNFHIYRALSRHQNHK